MLPAIDARIEYEILFIGLRNLMQLETPPVHNREEIIETGENQARSLRYWLIPKDSGEDRSVSLPFCSFGSSSGKKTADSLPFVPQEPTGEEVLRKKPPGGLRLRVAVV